MSLLRVTNYKVPAMALLLLNILLFVGCEKKKSVPEKVLTLPRGAYDVIKMANGATVEAHTESTIGTNNALITTATADAYALHLTLNITIPEPATTMEDLCAATPELPTALPNLEGMLPQPLPDNSKQASPFYTTLFNNKVKALQHQLSHLGQLPSRDSLYDCQTILPLLNQQTGRRALLIQAIMNVNADGSDGDRNIPLEKLSVYYQPQTNYRWPKSSPHPNPNITDIEQQSALWEKTKDEETATLEQKNKLQQQIATAQTTLQELKHWSFLIGSADPFIVLPKFMLEKNGQNAAIGDYAVVLYQGTLYPAIVGDIGPSAKIGEASLRLCRAIDPKSGADHRPLSSPHVSYFVFPGSAELPFTAPNYPHWSERCHQLWSELGGSSTMTWHEWISLEQPWP